jgi:small GTP-binding protein
VVIVGDAAVGKTSIASRFVHNNFRHNNVATIGASFLSKKIETSPGTFIKFNIWDTAGQEKYRSVASLYYRGIACALLVYDITQKVCSHAFVSVSSFLCVFVCRFRIHLQRLIVFGLMSYVMKLLKKMR